MSKLQNTMVMGGSGFIGFNFINYIFNSKDFNSIIVNADKLTYAGNLDNLQEIEKQYGNKRYSFENTPYDLRSPYSASKTSSDHLVSVYYYTYGLPVTISNCSNNYGPYQFLEKLLPLMILNMNEEKPLPVY